MKTGYLYLIPNIIADNTENDVITPRVRVELQNITHFLAEDLRTARRYLKSLNIYESIELLKFELLNKDTSVSELRELFTPVFNGFHVGVISDAGCPGIADPGSLAVKYAHDNNIKVIALVGPSSILLALMASGLNGQRFAFHGYLPIDPRESSKAIRDLEKESRQRNQTQLFIETPYRSNALFSHLIKTLHDETLLSVAIDLTSPSEEVLTYPVGKWRIIKKGIAKKPDRFFVFSLLINRGINNFLFFINHDYFCDSKLYE